jgi:hypothetical protein
VFAFINSQRTARFGPAVVRPEDGERGLSARTIKRRLASVSGFFAYFVVRGTFRVRRNPVPHGMATRRLLRSTWSMDHTLHSPAAYVATHPVAD